MLRPWQQESCTRGARVRTGLLAVILPNDNAAAPLMARRRNGRGQRLGIVKEETRFTQRHASQIKHITHEYPSCLGIDVTDLFAVIVSKQRSASESRRACSDSAHEMQSRNTQVHTRICTRHSQNPTNNALQSTSLAMLWCQFADLHKLRDGTKSHHPAMCI